MKKRRRERVDDKVYVSDDSKVHEIDRQNGLPPL